MNPKQAIVLRKDLNMRKGKMIAQGAHASMKVLLDYGSFDEMDDTKQKYFTLLLHKPELHQWIAGNFRKICLGCGSEQELLELYEKAKAAGLLCSLIQDSGLTEFAGIPTYTAIAVGPADEVDVDKITGHLSLL